MRQARLVTVQKCANPPTPRPSRYYSLGQNRNPGAICNCWDSSGTQQGAVAPCSCPMGSTEYNISLYSRRLLGSYFQRYYLKNKVLSEEAAGFFVSAEIIRCR